MRRVGEGPGVGGSGWVRAREEQEGLEVFWLDF